MKFSLTRILLLKLCLLFFPALLLGVGGLTGCAPGDVRGAPMESVLVMSVPYRTIGVDSGGDVIRPDPSIRVSGNMATSAYKGTIWTADTTVTTHNGDPFTVSLHREGVTVNGVGTVRAASFEVDAQGVPRLVLASGDDAEIAKASFADGVWSFEGVKLLSSTVVEAQGLSFQQATEQFRTFTEAQQRVIIETVKEQVALGKAYAEAITEVVSIAKAFGVQALPFFFGG